MNERPHAITGEMSRLYDVFVDWKGRLGRELPGIEARLAAGGARRILDVGCGTGQHVAALLARGYDAHGADASADMLAKASALGIDEHDGARRLHAWRLGDPPPDSLAVERERAPFDAVLALGNVWPQLVDPRDLAAVPPALRTLLRPGGLVVLGLKAFRVRRERGEPYLPLLKREHEGRALWFVRFVDFDVPQPDDHAVCDLHMSVLAGEADQEPEALLHRANRVRAWGPDELTAWLEEAGFVDVTVSGRMDDPGAEVTGEDVFVGARTATN